MKDKRLIEEVQKIKKKSDKRLFPGNKKVTVKRLNKISQTNGN